LPFPVILVSKTDDDLGVCFALSENYLQRIGCR